MAEIELARGIADDFVRIAAHLLGHDVSNPEHCLTEIIAAIQILKTNPRIGRPARNGRRELVIGRDSHGYIALYTYSERTDSVYVLAIRSQKESGYTRA